MTNQTINEDTATTALVVTVGDSETVASSLTLTAVAADTTLLPLSRITLGGSGANRTVTLSPATDHSGSTLVTLTVGDGTTTTSSTFTLTVTAVNDAPRLGTSLSTITGEVGVALDVILPSSAFLDVDGDQKIWRVSALPAGLSFDPLTRRLGGKPTTMGEMIMHVTCRDPSGLEASQAVTVRVIAARDVPETSAESSGETGAADSRFATANDSSTCGLGGGFSVLVVALMARFMGPRRRQTAV